MHPITQSFSARFGLFRKLAAWAYLLCLPAGAIAAYPEQPINMIIAYAPGGGTDIAARVMMPFIEKYLGEGAKINIVNRPGASGDIGFSALAAATPDGYTIGFINTPPVLTTPIERKTGYTWQSFDLLGNVVDDPGTFCVHADSQFKSLAEIAAHAKANPGAVTVGTTGVGSDDHLAMLQFEKSAGVKMNHIPFKGSSETRTAVTGKQIMVAAINVGEALQYLKGGSPIRCLGQMTQVRSSMAPDWPTFKEQGYNFEMASLRGIAAPKGLPAAIRERLVNAIERAAADPALRVQAERVYAPLRFLGPAAYEAELRSAEALFRQIWIEAPWTDR